VRTTHSLQNIFLFFVFGDIFVCTISLISEHYIYSTCNNIISKIGCVIAERVSNKVVVGEKNHLWRMGCKKKKIKKKRK
jgi:hypothetical protein